MRLTPTIKRAILLAQVNGAIYANGRNYVNRPTLAALERNRLVEWVSAPTWGYVLTVYGKRVAWQLEQEARSAWQARQQTSRRTLPV